MRCSTLCLTPHSIYMHECMHACMRVYWGRPLLLWGHMADIMMGSSATPAVRSRGRRYDGLCGPFQLWLMFDIWLYGTVLRAGSFDIHGVLSIHLDLKTDGLFCSVPSCTALPSIDLICLALWLSILFCSVLFCSVVPCQFLSRVASCCTDSHRIASVVHYLYSTPFYAMRHCDVALLCSALYYLLFAGLAFSWWSSNKYNYW